MYKGKIMHRTQLNFDEVLFDSLKARANSLGVSISEYIRGLVKQDLEQNLKNKNDFSKFAGMWEDRDITLEDIREKAWR